MTVTVNQKLCEGCGVCVQNCPNAAIYLCDGKALIDQSRCNSCKLCIEICPGGAIQLLEVQHSTVVTNSGLEIVPSQPITETPHKQTDWAGVALSLVGQHILPRMMDVLVTHLERQLFSGVPMQCKTPTSRYVNHPFRCRRKYRGGTISQNRIERR